MRTSKRSHLKGWLIEALNVKASNGELPTNLRYLAYEAITAGVLDKRDSRSLTDAATDLRKNGTLPWEWFEDRTRRLTHNEGWDDPYGYAAAHVRALRLDPWDETRPAIITESEASASILASLADEYRVPLVPIRGQTAGFIHTTVARALESRPVHVLYLGDWDKAGVDIERNAYRNILAVADVESWHRVALTTDQVNEYGLTVIDRVDKRTRPPRSWPACEAEALSQSITVSLFREALDNLLPTPLDGVRVREREAIQELLARIGETP